MIISLWHVELIAMPIFFTLHHYLLKGRDSPNRLKWSLSLVLIYSIFQGAIKTELGLVSDLDGIFWFINFFLSCGVVTKNVLKAHSTEN